MAGKSLCIIIMAAMLSIAAIPYFDEKAFIFGQPPDTSWMYFYDGGYSYDRGNFVLETDNGQYMICGQTGYSILVIKTNAQGNQLWLRQYSEGNEGNCIQSTNDGGYIIAGKSGTSYYTDACLMKIDASGNMSWFQDYGMSGEHPDGAHWVEQTSDGGYIVLGYTTINPGSYDMYLIKTDAQGNQLWYRTYGGERYDEGFCVHQLSDDGYIFVGCDQISAYNDDVSVFRTDANGNVIWNRTYGNTSEDLGFEIQKTNDDGYIIIGSAGSVGADASDIYLIKIDSVGNPVWERTYGGPLLDQGRSVQQTYHGWYIITGTATSVGEIYSDIYIMETDDNGDTLWTQQFGGAYDDYGYCVKQVQDGGFIVTGKMYLQSTSNDAFLLRYEGQPQTITITMIPINPPIQIPASGGSFVFSVGINNLGVYPTFIDIWIMQRIPSGLWQGPMLGPISLYLPGGANIRRQRIQNVPGAAPPGSYYYCGYVGIYSATKLDSSGFDFTKLNTGHGRTVYDWCNTGDNFCFNVEFKNPVLSKPNVFMSSPSPFNPSTSLRFDLPAPAHVRLEVFDTAGRLIRTLVEERRQAGSHAVTFDGSGLPSGLYFARLTAGDYTQTQKLVLLK
ncbi:MAG: T9SS C-terminal target domain-containing protein [Candidatus Zixiibacteriota bacterium]|nr:MAG: T9SS C-terminal target domain-containing protein [candidate division Zixibacteria bacterium]